MLLTYAFQVSADEAESFKKFSLVPEHIHDFVSPVEIRMLRHIAFKLDYTPELGELFFFFKVKGRMAALYGRDSHLWSDLPWVAEPAQINIRPRLMTWDQNQEFKFWVLSRLSNPSMYIQALL